MNVRRKRQVPRRRRDLYYEAALSLVNDLYIANGLRPRAALPAGWFERIGPCPIEIAEEGLFFPHSLRRECEEGGGRLLLAQKFVRLFEAGFYPDLLA